MIEIIPINKLSIYKENNQFINVLEKKSFYRIYFNDSKMQIRRNYIKNEDYATKITIKIDAKINSLAKLFHKCEIIKEIKFKVFNKAKFLDMSSMFSYCINLIKLDVSVIKTDKVRTMNDMFGMCLNLKELNLSNFKTHTVKDMSLMFYGCQSLQKLDISNFITYEDCLMNSMFEKCKSLNFSDISQLYIPYYQKNGKNMFKDCSEFLKEEIRKQRPHIREIAFE